MPASAMRGTGKVPLTTDPIGMQQHTKAAGRGASSPVEPSPITRLRGRYQVRLDAAAHVIQQHSEVQGSASLIDPIMTLLPSCSHKVILEPLYPFLYYIGPVPLLVARRHLDPCT